MIPARLILRAVCESSRTHRLGVAEPPQWRWLLCISRVHRARQLPAVPRTSTTHFATFMTDTTINLRDYQIPRWRKLAEQRLEHITELFVTGRWQRYFS